MKLIFVPYCYRKEQRKTDEKITVDHPTSSEQSVVNTTTVTTINASTSAISTATGTTISVTTLPSSSTLTTTANIDRNNIVSEVKTLTTSNAIKKVTNIGGKPVAVVKTNAAQSLLQSSQQHFPHHQIQVSTSAGLQTIRLSGHSVLHSAQPTATNTSSCIGNTTTNLATIFPNAKVQNQQQQQTVVTSQTGKSILQTSNIKQQSQQPHVLPGKTLLASQIKLVSSGQIKSLLTGHGLQGQTIFIKQSSPSNNQSQQLQQQQQQLKVKLKEN